MKCRRKTVFKFDDEMKSLLSSNLWEIGWYSLLQDECESEIGTEKPGGISVIDRDAIQCNFKSVTTSKSALFELVVLSQACTETTFSHMQNTMPHTHMQNL